jgi:isopenicillin N synthase-like dioxygenase
MEPPAELQRIDIGPLLDGGSAEARESVAGAIRSAAGRDGLFYVVGHGVRPETLTTLEREASAFFALPDTVRAEIAMSRGGRAWRGWFPLGGELTSGRPDRKEGLYFGEELPPDDPRVQAGVPLHGPNLWPAQAPGLRPAVEAYVRETTRAAHALAEGVSLALGLDADHLARRYTGRPTILFRIFRYPPAAPAEAAWADSYGVGEHTDYGFLTLLAQDRHGGLEVKTARGWVDAPPVPGALVCNIGDMLDRLSGGRLRSAPHRVRNRSAVDRYSFPLFFDPAFDAEVRPLPGSVPDAGLDAATRWDGESPHAASGTYGAYLLRKVGRVFPELGAQVRLEAAPIA